MGLRDVRTATYNTAMMPMTTTQSVQIFLRALQGQNYSSKTLRAYGDDLTQFLTFVQKNRVDC